MYIRNKNGVRMGLGYDLTSQEGILLLRPFMEVP